MALGSGSNSHPEKLRTHRDLAAPRSAVSLQFYTDSADEVKGTERSVDDLVRLPHEVVSECVRGLVRVCVCRRVCVFRFGELALGFREENLVA